jgi:hypothetical protein
MFRYRSEELSMPHSDGRVTDYWMQTFQEEGKKPVFVFSDVPHNKGPRVENCTQEIARDLNKHFAYEPKDIQFYERRPDGRYNKPSFEYLNGNQIHKRTNLDSYSEEEVTQKCTAGILYKPAEQIVDQGLSQDDWMKGDSPASVDRGEFTLKEVAALEQKEEQRNKQKL